MPSVTAGFSLPPLRRGASIAVFKDEAVLLVERAKAPWRGLWSLPGGNLEPNESPRHAALRELREETGIEAEIDGLLDVIQVEAPDEDGKLLRYRLSVFYGRRLAGTMRPGGDAAAARFVALGDLDTFELTQGTAELIRLAARLVEPSRA